MTSTTSAHISAPWPLSADAPDANLPVTLSASAPLGALNLICDSFRVMGAFAFGKRQTRQSSAAMCELMDRMN